MKHHPNSPIGRRSTGPHIARKAAGHIQRNAAKPGRDWMGGRTAPAGGAIDPTATAAPPPGGAMPMGGEPPMGGGAPMPPGGDEGLGGL